MFKDHCTKFNFPPSLPFHPLLFGKVSPFPQNTWLPTPAARQSYPNPHIFDTKQKHPGFPSDLVTELSECCPQEDSYSIIM